MQYLIEHCATPGDETSARLRLEGEVTLESAEHLKTALIEALDAYHRVTVDCSKATLVDLAALQLLCVAHRTAAASGRTLSLADLPAGVFEKAISEAGFQRHRACFAAATAGEACLWQSDPKI